MPDPERPLTVARGTRSAEQSRHMTKLAICGIAVVTALCCTDKTVDPPRRSAAAADPPRAPAAPVAARELPKLPPGEADFCSIVGDQAARYRSERAGGANELVLSRFRSARKAALKEYDGNIKGRVTGWLGTLKKLGTTKDGSAHVVIQLPCDENVRVKTWNNSFSDTRDSTLIAQSSPLFDALSRLSKGDHVRFSGAFVLDPSADYFREASVGEKGAMVDPEFIFKFSSVSPL
jgi:hypothetical protein